MKGEWTLFFDGSCEPFNPGGHACAAWILYLPDGNLYDSGSLHVRSGEGATSNVAEYWGLISGLLHMQKSSLRVPLLVKGDSQLILNQVTQRWKCKKKHLRKLRDETLLLLNQVGKPWSVQWIPREENHEADALSTSVELPPDLPILVYPEWALRQMKRRGIIV